MGFLDNAGLSHFWGKVQTALERKQDRISGILGQVAGFSTEGTPEAQYLNLSHLSDGNPIGTIITFMGVKAPSGYLVCDGQTYRVDTYPDLADFFRQQFGNAGYFGGDGEDTFAVPDMRNLFLRGYHGEAEELSGDIGQVQAGTEIPTILGSGGSAPKLQYLTVNAADNSVPKNSDNKINALTGLYQKFVAEGAAPAYWPDVNGLYGTHYTARPVNMAVLYCIKAVQATPATK